MQSRPCAVWESISITSSLPMPRRPCKPCSMLGEGRGSNRARGGLGQGRVGYVHGDAARWGAAYWGCDSNWHYASHHTACLTTRTMYMPHHTHYASPYTLCNASSAAPCTQCVPHADPVSVQHPVLAPSMCLLQYPHAVSTVSQSLARQTLHKHRLVVEGGAEDQAKLVPSSPRSLPCTLPLA